MVSITAKAWEKIGLIFIHCPEEVVVYAYTHGEDSLLLLLNKWTYSNKEGNNILGFRYLYI